MNVRLYEKAIEWIRAGKRVAVVTIISTIGSTPRKAGAKMLVSDRLDLYGTIGGGCVEGDVILAARDVLKTMKPRVISVDIKAKNADEIDMLCGGEVTLYVEPVMPDYQLLICGGGHISRALANVCHGLEFRTTVVDDREQFANTDRFPSIDEAISCDYAQLSSRVTITPLTFCVVVTRGHTGDEVCLRQLLTTAAPYIAMVGSRGKWAILKKNLRDGGISEEQIGRVVCPAGIDIHSITPEEIAISIAAQLIQVRAKVMTINT